MRKIVLSTVTLALIAASAPQAFAAHSYHARKATQAATSEQLRDRPRTPKCENALVHHFWSRERYNGY